MGLSADDKLAIQEHIARRAHASDYPNTDAWVDTFTEDAVLEMPADAVLDLPGGAAEMETTVRGADGLRKFLDGHLPNMVGLRHWVTNIVIDGDGDSATATCMFNLIDTGKGGKSVVTGRYINTLKRTDQGWKTSHQICEMDPKVDES